MIDTLVALRGPIERESAARRSSLEPGRFLVVTLHRPALVDGPLLSRALNALDRVASRLEVVFQFTREHASVLSTRGSTAAAFAWSSRWATSPFSVSSWTPLTRRLRSHAMTSGTWDRHRGHAASYDVTGVGYNYRLDEPRAALLNARLPRLEEDIASRRWLVRRYRRLLAGVDGITVPYRDADVEASSCYVMPVMVDDARLRDPLRRLMLERSRVQTSLHYPAIHELTAYADPTRPALPRSELAARTEVTIPLYPHLTEEDQDRVVAALAQGIVELSAPAGAARAG